MTVKTRSGGGKIAKLLAMAAMVLQVLFVADHIGASAVKAFGDVPFGAQMGFLEICSGAGAVALDDSPGGPVQDCPICENAAVMAFGELAELVGTAAPVVCFGEDCAQQYQRQATVFRFPKQQPIRAPPFVLS